MERLEPVVPKPEALSSESVALQDAPETAGEDGAFLYFRRYFRDGESLVRGGEGEFLSEFTIVFLVGDQATVGSHPDCEIAIDWDPAVARAHSELKKAGPDWYIDNIDQTNGTLVNGVRVDRVEEHFLADGDRIRLGDTILVFRQPGLVRPKPPEPMSAGEPPPMITQRQKEVLVALVRPIAGTDLRVSPSSNSEIAEEVSLDEDTVKGHLRNLYKAFGLSDVPDHEKRQSLAWRALELGSVTDLDLSAR